MLGGSSGGEVFPTTKRGSVELWCPEEERKIITYHYILPRRFILAKKGPWNNLSRPSARRAPAGISIIKPRYTAAESVGSIWNIGLGKAKVKRIRTSGPGLENVCERRASVRN